MAFNGTEGQFIDAETANRWISNYQATEPKGIKAEFFGREKLEALLAQGPNVMGLRIYYAKDDREGWRLILCAADAEQRNIAPIDGTLQGLILDEGHNCPPYCAPK